jgi:hypothetical protein
MAAEDMTNEMTNEELDDEEYEEEEGISGLGDEFEIMENDFESLIERVKMTITAIKGE